MNEDKLSPTDLLNRRIMRYTSEARLLLVRNLCFGAAAACLVVVSQIIQVGAKDRALEVSVISGCVSMPLWIAAGAIYEYFLNLGKQSYPFLQSKPFRVCCGLLMIPAALGLLIEAGAAFWYLSEIAAWTFAGSTVLASVIVIFFRAALAGWWYGQAGPASKSKST